MTQLPYMAAVLEASAEDEQIDLRRLRVAGELDRSAMKELEAAALEGANDSLGAPNAFDAPVYCDEANRWNVFLSEHGRFEQYVIKDSGDLDHIRSVDPNAVRLLVPDESGRKVLADYIRVLNNRDSIVGLHLLSGGRVRLRGLFPQRLSGRAVDLDPRPDLAGIADRTCQGHEARRCTASGKASSTTTWTGWMAPRSVHSFEPG